MAQEQLSLVQGSFRQAVPVAGRLAASFYARLFDIAPQTRQAWIAAYGPPANCMKDAAVAQTAAFKRQGRG